MSSQSSTAPITRSQSTTIHKYTNFRPPIHEINQRQVIPKPATTRAIKQENDNYLPMIRVIDMSGMDVSSFPDVILMKSNQMSRFSKQKQDSFKIEYKVTFFNVSRNQIRFGI